MSQLEQLKNSVKRGELYMKKMLMLASVVSMIDQFNMPNIEILIKQGYEVHVAANFEYGSTSSKERVEEFKKELEGMGITYFQVDFSRNITDIKSNIKAYKQIKDMMIKYKYEFIHCHSPIGGVCGRLAAHKTKTTVIYTAHGFHFFKGSPIKNWVIFYPVEWFLSYYTDVLITINKEDYERALKNFHSKKTFYIPGIGLDTKKFRSAVVNKEAKRKEIGIPSNAIMLFSVGELVARKNHEVVIRAMIKAENKNLYLVICGRGDLMQYLKDLSKELGVANRVLLLGFRTDIVEICRSADIYVFPSKREGLGIAALEGMATGLPLISSYINGIKDYTKDGETGFCLEPNDLDGFSRAMDRLANDENLRNKIGNHNLEVVKGFDIEIVNKIMYKIYIG